MIYVKEGLHFKCRDDFESRGIECIGLKLQITTNIFFFHCFIGHQIPRH